MIRASPQQYFEERQPNYGYGVYPEPTYPNNTLYFIMISIIAGLALGLAIGALCKK